MADSADHTAGAHQSPSIESSGLTRRDFLKGAAALQLGLFVTKLGADVVLARVDETGQPVAPPGAGSGEIDALAQATPLNIYVSIDADDTVTIVVPRPDMGQGSRTSLAMHVAEELEADWDRVVVLQGDASSEYGISQTAGGSTSTRNFWDQTRQAGAAARLMLVGAAAEMWGVSPDSTRCALGVVHHDDSDRSATYGELAAAAAGQSVPANPALKSPADYTIIGQSTRRKDAPRLVDGSGVFGADLRVPGMLHAAVARPHAFGSRITDHDDAAALATPGVKHVVSASGGLAVVADSTWAALQGRERLQITWSPGPYVGVDDAEIRSRLVQGTPSLPSMPSGTERVIEATFDVPYLAHAPMEPMNCLAHVHDGRCEVWAPTQAPGTARSSVARALGLSESNVTVTLDPNANAMDGAMLERLRRNLERLCRVRVLTDVAVVSMVGQKIRAMLPQIGSALEVFEENRIHLLSQAASDLNLSFVV
ncbi:MAG: molybdopterin cofactor-binding domain-containing protein, partial [Anaerolineae bacterium]